MTIADPFASAPAAATVPDEAQQTTTTPAQDDPWASPPPEATKPAAAAPRPVVAQSEGKIVLTFKGGSGFEAPWIVIHAQNIDEAADYLSPESGPKLLDLMTRVQNAGQHFAGLAPAGSKSSGGGNRGGSRSNAPQGAKEPPAGTPPAPDSSYEYKSGSKNGKPWHAWMPPKGSGKDVVWLDSNLLK